MSTYVRNNTLSGDLSTDAAAQALWGWVDGLLQGDGWSYVAQTGDGNPNSMTTGAINTYPVFRVYSTSAGSGPETWYMRLDYGHTGLGPSFKVQLGSGVNGSGTLTGQVGVQTTLNCGTSMASAGKYFAVCLAAGRFFFHANWPGTTGSGNPSWAFACHMEVNANGVMSTGMWVGCFGATTSSAPILSSQTIPISGTVPPADLWLPVAIGSAADKTIGVRMKTFHFFTWNESLVNNPNPAMIFIGTSNGYAGGATNANLYSTARTYLQTGFVNPLTAGSAGSSNNRLAFLWE